MSSGKILWHKNFSGKFKKPHGMWGVAASPLIEGGLCITGIGTEDDGAIAAFKADSGELVWQLKGREPSYSSPVAADLGGRRQMIVLTRTQLLGVAPPNGEILWELPYKVKYEQNIVTPNCTQDRVFIAGWEEPTLGLKLTASAGKLTAAQVWSNAGVTFFMSSPVLAAGHLFGLAQQGKGSLVCIEAASGKLVWKSEGGLGEYASIVSAGDKLLVLTDKGILRVVAADPNGYKELQNLQIGTAPVWSHLAVANDCLFIKDKTHLRCFALR